MFHLYLAVSANQTITNSEYGAWAEGGYMVAGETAVVTVIEPPQRYYLPLTILVRNSE